MHILSFSLLVFLAYNPTTLAAPAGRCNVIDVVVALLRGPLKAEASTFCLSYLGGDHTKTITATQTVTGLGMTTVLTEPDQTQQTTIQSTNVNLVTQTIEVQAPNPTVTITQTTTAATKTIYQKREEKAAPAVKRGIPPALSLFAASRISSACSCFVTPATRTFVPTTTQTVAGPQATQTVEGKTVIVTITQTVQVTSIGATTVQTDPATGTNTVVTVTTVTPILVKPKICNAKGLPGANAFNYDANFNTDQASCIASCKTDNRCLSTGFYLVTDPTTGATTGTCRYYDKSVTDSADLGFGYYNFNDKAC